jgi:hypothetical protein
MDFAEGGKIDTVLYNAATGALNSTASAGTGAAICVNPKRAMAKPQNAKVLPRLPDRSRLPVSPIRRHTSSKKTSRKLPQRFHDAKTGCMIAHRKRRARSAKVESGFASDRALNY